MNKNINTGALALIAAACVLAALLIAYGTHPTVPLQTKVNCPQNLPKDPTAQDRGQTSAKDYLRPPALDCTPLPISVPKGPAIAVPAGAEKVGADGGR